MRKKRPLLTSGEQTAGELNWFDKIRPEKRLLKGRAYLTIKMTMDFSIILFTIPLWLPLLAFSALLIKMESPRGPVFYTQYRTGKGGNRFCMYKFRTMVPNADELKKEYSHLNELQWPDFKITKDPRVTRMGRFLRKTSLDELPQLLNVLKGQMSLVGPRPTSFSAKTYSVWHTERLDVPAGITGLWQIVARGSADLDERMRLDIIYIERSCLWLDILILLRTFTSLLAQRGVY